MYVQVRDGVDLILRALHQGEKYLTEELTSVAERHRTDHEVHHVATDLAHWSREHVQQLADTGQAHGLSLSDPPVDDELLALVSACHPQTLRFRRTTSKKVAVAGEELGSLVGGMRISALRRDGGR